MWLARYFPGLGLTLEQVDQMTLAETNMLRKAGKRILAGEAEERIAHTRVIASAAGMRLR